LVRSKIEDFILKTNATLELTVRPNNVTAMLYNESDLFIQSFKGLTIGEAIEKAVKHYNEGINNKE